MIFEGYSLHKLKLQVNPKIKNFHIFISKAQNQNISNSKIFEWVTLKIFSTRKIHMRKPEKKITLTLISYFLKNQIIKAKTFVFMVNVRIAIIFWARNFDLLNSNIICSLNFNNKPCVKAKSEYYFNKINQYF